MKRKADIVIPESDVHPIPDHVIKEEVDRLKKRLAALQTENAVLKTGGGDEPNGEIKHVIPQTVSGLPGPVLRFRGEYDEPPTRKVEFKYRSGIEAEELADLVNDGWEIDYRCFLVPPQMVGLFVVLRRYVK